VNDFEAMQAALVAYDQAAVNKFNARFSEVFGPQAEDCRKFREDLLTDPYRNNLLDMMVKAHERQPFAILMRSDRISPEILVAPPI
jgi:hypothetical protein